MGDQAYRTFVPLMDFGPMFEQPVSAWRMREFFKLGTADIISIELWSAREHFKVDRQGSPTADNPQGWRMVSASANDNPVETAHFELDERRIATVVELMTPFMVDDWADGLSQLEIASFQFGGGITVGAKDRAYRIQIGPEVDFTQHPEWMPAGEGARYIRVEGDKRIGIISSRRLLGIFPSLDDMRTKRVWDADSTHLAAIEVQVGSHCLRYKPQRANVWESAACLSSETAIEAKAIPDKELANYAKVINALQAVRYATPEEKADISLKSAEVRLYMDAPDHLAYRLTLSDSIKNLYRYAQVWRGNVDGSEELGPIFVLSEGICRLLLSDLTAQ